MILPAPIREERVIAVARGLDATSAPRLAAALHAGGISTIEVTVEGKSGFEAIGAIDGSILVGAGTVVTIDEAMQAVDAGARFIVSPHFDPDIVEWAASHAVPVVPGAFTSTEVAAAWRLGPAAVKIFPAHVGGPGYLRSLLGPYPDLALIPTGGVDASNAASYLAAGATAVGVGGWLTSHDDMDVVTARAVELMASVV